MRRSAKNITLPDNVEYLGADIFYDTAYANDPANRENDILYHGQYLLAGTLWKYKEEEMQEDAAFEPDENNIVRIRSATGDVSIREGTTKMCEYAFERSLLTSVHFPSTLTEISFNGFAWCPNLKQAEIPGNIKKIAQSAFYGCRNLEQLTISKGVEEIDGFAFYHCTKLTDITIPKSVTKIGFMAFGYERADGYEKKVDDLVIRCYSGTAAETYVRDNGLSYVILDTGESFTAEKTTPAEDKINAGILCEEGENCASNRFSDLPPANKDVSHKGIEFCLKRGIINGKGNGIFDPSGVLTRAEFATMVYRFAGSPDAPETGKFTDLTEDWYKKAVNWAASCGVINGTSDTTFSPDNTVTREQLAAVFYRYAKAQGVDVTVAEARLLTNGAYADASQISDYALVPMSWCMTHYFFGTYSKLTPTGEIPLCAPRFNTFRRETTEAFFRFWNLLPKHSQAELA